VNTRGNAPIRKCESTGIHPGTNEGLHTEKNRESKNHRGINTSRRKPNSGKTPKRRNTTGNRHAYKKTVENPGGKTTREKNRKENTQQKTNTKEQRQEKATRIKTN